MLDSHVRGDSKDTYAAKDGACSEKEGEQGRKTSPLADWAVPGYLTVAAGELNK